MKCVADAIVWVVIIEALFGPIAGMIRAAKGNDAEE